MATDATDIVKQGYVKIKSKTLGVWQRRWIVLRRASSKGPCRLEKYLDEKTARCLLTHKTAFLTSVSSILRLSSSQKKHSFSLTFNDGVYKLISCDSDLEADNWVKLMLQECLLIQPGLATGEPDVLSPGIQKELQEQFHVHLLPTPKLDVFGECILQVTHENIYLWDAVNSKIKLVAWPLTALRRYGSDPTKFTFEAGRHCATGEGMFVFHTLEGEKIYRKVHQATLSIAEAHHKSKRLLNKTEASSSTSTTATITTTIKSPKDTNQVTTTSATMSTINCAADSDSSLSRTNGLNYNCNQAPPLPSSNHHLIHHHNSQFNHHHQNNLRTNQINNQRNQQQVLQPNYNQDQLNRINRAAHSLLTSSISHCNSCIPQYSDI